MNRAWIPAGALAGVSVAGLLALGPLTDSMSTPVAFPDPVTIPKTAADAFRPVSVTVDDGTVGNVRRASLRRGGQATATTPRGTDFGYVAYNKNAATAGAVKAATSSSSTAAPAKPKKVKKAIKRQGSIGAPGETNPSAGLASGDPSGQRADGEQASNLTGDGN